MSSRKRLLGLDALRGIAAIGVLLHHYIFIYAEKYGYRNIKFENFEIEQSIGRYGVELFFIISGFVISMSLENKKGVKYFFISRFSRLFPTFWFCLFLTSILKITTGTPLPLEQLLFNLTMIPQFFWIEPIDGSYWTLLYELFFYTLIGALFGINRQLSIVPLALILIISTALLVIFEFTPSDSRLAYFLLIPHFQLFFAGVIFYKLWKLYTTTETNNNNKRHYWLVIVTLVILQWALSLLDNSRLNIYSAIMITLFFMTFSLLIVKNLNFLKNKLLIHLGVISYPLYLIHQEIGYIFIQYFTRFTNDILALCISTLIIIILAHFINRFIEVPSDKYFKKKLLKILSPNVRNTRNT